MIYFPTVISGIFVPCVKKIGYLTLSLLFSGQKFAMFQLKITVCKILRKFKLILSDDPKDKIRPHFGMIVTSANGMMIRIQSRHRNNGL